VWMPIGMWRTLRKRTGSAPAVVGRGREEELGRRRWRVDAAAEVLVGAFAKDGDSEPAHGVDAWDARGRHRSLPGRASRCAPCALRPAAFAHPKGRGGPRSQGGGRAFSGRPPRSRRRGITRDPEGEPEARSRADDGEGRGRRPERGKRPASARRGPVTPVPGRVGMSVCPKSEACSAGRAFGSGQLRIRRVPGVVPG
jgi:hypothetical protein